MIGLAIFGWFYALAGAMTMAFAFGVLLGNQEEAEEELAASGITLSLGIIYLTPRTIRGIYLLTGLETPTHARR